jgi:hypothetical protein
MAGQALGIIELSFIENVANIDHGGGNCTRSYLCDGRDYASHLQGKGI